jgi:hypothetical protein
MTALGGICLMSLVCACAVTTPTSPAPITKTVTVPPAPASTTEASGSTPPAPSAAAAAPMPPKATMNTCTGQVVSAPSEYVLACADYGISLKGLRWSQWGDPVAHAAGDLWENDCNPACYAGHFVPYPASVEVSGLAGSRYTWLHVNAPQAPGGPYDYTIGAHGP